MVPCWIAVYAARHGRATIASAGHPPAIVIDGSGATLAIGSRFPPLGSGVWFNPSTFEVELVPGGVLLAYTDGLVERRTVAIDVCIDALVDEVLRTAKDGVPEEGWLTPLVARVFDDHPPTDDVCALALVRF